MRFGMHDVKSTKNLLKKEKRPQHKTWLLTTDRPAPRDEFQNIPKKIQLAKVLGVWGISISSKQAFLCAEPVPTPLPKVTSSYAHKVTQNTLELRWKVFISWCIMGPEPDINTHTPPARKGLKKRKRGLTSWRGVLRYTMYICIPCSCCAWTHSRSDALYKNRPILPSSYRELMVNGEGSYIS